MTACLAGSAVLGAALIVVELGAGAVPVVGIALGGAFGAGLRLRQPSATPSPAVDGWSVLHRELERSRRGEGLLTLARIAVPAGRADEVRERMHPLVRSIDTAWVEGDAVLVVLPESGRAAAERLAVRMKEALPDVLPSVVMTTAVFPEDGLTTGALLATLQEPVRVEQGLRTVAEHAAAITDGLVPPEPAELVPPTPQSTGVTPQPAR